MEHVHHDRRANFRIVEEVGHVEAEERRIERQSIDLVVEHPTQRSASRPFLKPSADAFRIALAEQLARGQNGSVFRCEPPERSEGQSSEPQSLMRIPYAGICLKKKTQ